MQQAPTLRHWFGRLSSLVLHNPLLKGAGALLLVRCGSLFLGYFGTLLVVRWLGADQAGIYVYCVSLILSFAAASNLGFSRASLRFIAQYRAHGQRALVAGVIKAARGVTLATSSIVALAGIAVVELGHVDPAWRLPLILAFATIPFASLLLVNTDTALGFGWSTFAYVPDQLFRNAATIAGIGAWFIIRGYVDATDATAILLAMYALTAACQLAELSRRAPLGTLKPEADMRIWVATSLPLWLGMLSDILIERIDVLLIGYFLPPKNIAIFNAASRTAALAIMIQYAVATPASSTIAALYARGRTDELHTLVRQLLFWTIWPSIAFALLLALAGPTILRIFGPEFSAGAPVFYILLTAQMIAICMGPGYVLLTLTGHQKTVMKTIASATLISVVLNWLLIPVAGIEGAAIATGTTIIFRAVMLAIFARRHLGINTISFMPKPPARLGPRRPLSPGPL